MPRLGVLVASTRPGRIGLPIATWFAAFAKEEGSFEVDFIDLAEVGLPLLNEPVHPRLKRYQHEETKRWSERIEALDALVIVTPEYNYFAPPALVNAVDYLFHEWRFLPVGILSYGGISAGLRAAQSVRQLIQALRMSAISEAVALPMVMNDMHDGQFVASQIAEESAGAMLAELARQTPVLAQLRRAVVS